LDRFSLSTFIFTCQCDSIILHTESFVTSAIKYYQMTESLIISGSRMLVRILDPLLLLFLVACNPTASM